MMKSMSIEWKLEEKKKNLVKTLLKKENINNELIKKHFNFQSPSVMLKSLNDINDIEKKNELVSVIVSGLKDLKKEIKEMAKEEKKLKSQII